MVITLKKQKHILTAKIHFNRGQKACTWARVLDPKTCAGEKKSTGSQSSKKDMDQLIFSLILIKNKISWI